MEPTGPTTREPHPEARSGELRAAIGLPRPPRRIGTDLVAFLHDGGEAYPAMLEAIARAEREILLEMYWFVSDKTGLSFARALSERAKQGVEVLVIYDAFGSIEADASMFESMAEAGCKVIQYGPIAPWHARFRLNAIERRDHRKILVVDRAIAMTGGVNIGDPWAAVADGGLGWRDDAIYVEGPAARELCALVLGTWKRLGGSPPRLGSEPAGVARSFADVPVRVHGSHDRGRRRAIRKMYLARIEGAALSISIVNSYFVPDLSVRRALARAVARGAKVRVLLPAVSDIRAVHYASRHLYDWLMRRGIEIYEWPDSVLHAKTAVVDDRWLTIGTYNLDYRSWRFNLEANVAVDDKGAARELRVWLDADFSRSHRIEPSEFAARPLAERFLEWFFWLFRELL